jgi:hypothetical protein
MPRNKKQRGPRIVKNAIRVKWGTVDGDGPDLCVSWGDNQAKGTARQIVYELEKMARKAADHGWDITTLKFEIKRTPEWILANSEK